MSSLNIPPKLLNFSDDPMIIEVGSGASADAENVTCSVRIYTFDGNFIARINPPYSASGKMVTDISNLFGFNPPLPSTTLTANKSHPESSGKYVLYHADRSGIPPENGSSGVTDHFTVIRGSSYNFNGFGDGSQPWYLLHSYFVRDHKSLKPVVKIVSPSTPEVYYFYSESGATINYNAKLKSIDGTGDVVTGSFSVPAGVSSRYMSLDQLGSPLQDVVSYTITLQSGTVSHTISYQVDRHENDYERFVLFENGCGGMEVVRFAGRHSRSHSVSKRSSMHPVWSGYNHAKGQSSISSVEGGEVIELNTGYYTKSYIQHLEQMIYSDAWMIDTYRNKLIKYEVVTNSLKVHSDIDNKHNITISLKPAHIRRSANTFGQ